MKVKDLKDDFVLISDHLEIRHIIRNYCPEHTPYIGEYGALFVRAINGDIVAIYGSESSVPCLDDTLDRLMLKK